MSKEKLAYKNKLLDAISYSRLNKGHLNTWDIIYVFQHLSLGRELPSHIKTKIETITNLIKQTKWTRPILRIGSELQTEILNPKTGKWEPYKPTQE
jgi:hypothetical protein